MRLTKQWGTFRLTGIPMSGGASRTLGQQLCPNGWTYVKFGRIDSASLLHHRVGVAITPTQPCGAWGRFRFQGTTPFSRSVTRSSAASSRSFSSSARVPVVQRPARTCFSSSPHSAGVSPTSAAARLPALCQFDALGQKLPPMSVPPSKGSATSAVVLSRYLPVP
jgi:hypothetical protein